MKQEIIIKADSSVQAVEQACNQLGKSRDELTIEVIREAKKSLFGKVKEQAEVKIIYDDGVVEKINEESLEEISEEKSANEKRTDNIDNKIELAVKYLGDVLRAMGLDQVEQEVVKEDDSVRIVLTGENLGVAIGRRGETLDALQYLVSLVANRVEGSYVRFIIDSGNFREKREETLRNLAAKIAKTTLKTGRNSTLEPMNPYERRIIHSVVSEIDGVYSKSVGEEPNRKVVVISENPRKYSGNRRGGSRRRDDNRNRGRKYDKEYVIPKDVSSKPSTYDFEKEFLKSEKQNTKLYSKIEFDE